VTVLGAIESRSSVEVDAMRLMRLWGVNAQGLHDRYWASKRIQVVRAGAGASTVDASGPALHLLLDAQQLTLFKLRPILTRLNWLKPRAVRARLVDRDEEAYAEHVEADEDGRLLGVLRDYRMRTLRAVQIIVTPDAKIARYWAESDGGLAARREVYRACGQRGVGAISMKGRHFEADQTDDLEEFFRDLLERWQHPEAVLDGVYSFQPGVWLHESVESAPGARFIAPVWVGAGVTLDPTDLVIGPRIVCDETPVSPPDGVDWDDLLMSSWRLTAQPLTARRIFGKRAFDILFSLAVLLMTAPLYPIIMIAILLEDGWPPFFAHRRQTIRGRGFPCLKFRTMRRDAEAMKAELIAKNQSDGPQFFMDNDPRLLRVGVFLRKTQLDEIPQFINVLLGHMSVVGPRPSPDKENQCCPAWREARLSVRPGVTGLWQVRRTREPQTDFQEWIRYDLEYVQHHSWRSDMIIILKTFTKIFGG
jgi:lipopolysaccharide/colanic/teichoic acid biosynthesis glycosyltransferase